MLAEKSCQVCGMPPDLCVCEAVAQEADRQKLTTFEKEEPVVEKTEEQPFGRVVTAVFNNAVINEMNGELELRGILQDKGEGVQINIPPEKVQELIRKALPDQEQQLQTLLDKIHKIRLDRVLFVNEIDKALEGLASEVKKEFDKCQSGTDVKRVEASFRVRLAIITQRRHVAKFSIQEESELSLQVAKLRHGGK